jgi:TonB family protein
MSSLFGFVASYVVNAVWEVALIVAVAWLTSQLLKRLGPQAEHMVWVAALAMAVVTPAVPVLRSLPLLVTGSRMGSAAAVITTASGDGGAAAHGSVFALSAFWMWWLLAGYAATLVYFAGRLTLKLIAAVRMLSSTSPVTFTPEQDEIWRSCARAFELRGVQVLACAKARGPAALRLRMPFLLLPPYFSSNCTPQDFLSAIAHECAHLKRRDFQKNLLYELSSLLLAFHPLIRVIQSGIAQTREMICDGMVTEEHVEAGTYARSLLRLAAAIAVGSRGSGNYAVGIFDGDILEKRIMRIRMKNQKAGAVIKYGLMISAAAILISTVVGTAVMAVPVVSQAESQDKAQSSTYGHVYKVGHGVSSPVLLHTVPAKYPELVRKKGEAIDGIVLLGLVVDANGMPQDIHIVKSFRADFDTEAVKAVKQYRFRPAMRSGKPVAVSVNVEVKFKWY